jgi:hypothetical protein
MDYLSTSASMAQEFFTRHGMPPVQPFSAPAAWMKPVLARMRSGALGSGAIDHTEVLTNGYLSMLMAAACRATDNVAAVDFASWAADDVIMQYLLYCERRGELKDAPGSMDERRTAIVRLAVSAICCAANYPGLLTESIIPFLGNRPKFRIRTNGDSRQVFPVSFDFGLPAARMTPVAPRVEDLDISDESPQFQYFFKGCTGSLRKGIKIDQRLLAMMQAMHQKAPVESGMFDFIQAFGSHAPRPTHDYATPGDYVLVSMMSLGAFTACMFARARFEPPMIYPDWGSWAIQFGTDDELGQSQIGLAALATMMQLPAEPPVPPTQEMELWVPSELPNWIAYQASWSARRGVPVPPNHYRSLTLERYLP